MNEDVYRDDKLVKMIVTWHCHLPCHYSAVVVNDNIM